MFIRNFGLGLGISGALSVLKNLGNIFTQPRVALKNILSTHNLRLPLFFGLLPLLFHVGFKVNFKKLVNFDYTSVRKRVKPFQKIFINYLMLFWIQTTNCTMNRIGVTNKMVKNMLSGGVAGLSMVAFPNVTIAMYVLWKAIEVSCKKFKIYLLYFDIIMLRFL